MGAKKNPISNFPRTLTQKERRLPCVQVQHASIMNSSTSHDKPMTTRATYAALIRGTLLAARSIAPDAQSKQAPQTGLTEATWGCEPICRRCRSTHCTNYTDRKSSSSERHGQPPLQAPAKPGGACSARFLTSSVRQAAAHPSASSPLLLRETTTKVDVGPERHLSVVVGSHRGEGMCEPPVFVRARRLPSLAPRHLNCHSSDIYTGLWPS